MIVPLEPGISSSSDSERKKCGMSKVMEVTRVVVKNVQGNNMNLIAVNNKQKDT